MTRSSLRLALAAATLTAVLGAAPAVLAQEEKTPQARGTGGAAATVDTLATQAAIDVLRDGGNAVDAAVAAAGVLGVVEPFSCGIGGGGFMVIRTADGDVTTIDGREKAPRAMRPDSFMENGRPLAFDPARFSGLSAGVPGTPLTWSRALNKYGTISLREALRPGMRVARRGFTVDQTFFDAVDAVKEYFDDVPSTAELYLDPDGTPKDVGTTIRNPDMARTYRLMRNGVRDGFYRGQVAEATAEAASSPPIAPTADHTWRPGLMTSDDLRRYTAPEREPVETEYRGLSVFGMGPPSSGGSTVGEALAILDGYPAPGGSSRNEILHRYLEASRYAFADRNAYLADPAFYDVPLEGLLSESFADERRALITDRAARSPVAPGDPRDNEGGESSATISHPRQSTTHLSVADRKGNVVSYTFTIESTGGNGIVVPGYGFLLNNELTDFNFDSTTHPNRANGSKRPRSSMAPTIVERDGRPYLAVGSPGGSTIIGTVLQILVRRIDLNEPLPRAIALPRAVERNTPTTQAEQAFIDTQQGRDLAGVYGHRFAPPSGAGEIGAATGIEIRGRRFVAAAEPERRGAGSAMVVRPSR